MGSCLPNNGTNNFITSNISKKEMPSTTQIFDNKNNHNSSPRKGKKNHENLEDKNGEHFNENNNEANNEDNNKRLKLNRSQSITTNINNTNININQISKSSDMRSSETVKNIENIKIVKAILTHEDKQNLKEIFTNHILFKNKSPQLISSIIESLEMMVIPKDTNLFNKEDIGDYFYVIKEGKIKLENEFGLKFLKENDTFGELALIPNTKRTTSAKAVENCKLLLLNGKTFRVIISKITEADFKERMSILSSSTIFSSLDNNKLNALASGLICCYFEANQKILYKGDIGQSIYIIKSGKVKCLNGEQEIRFLGPKDYFGEDSILFNMNRALSVHVEEATECYQLSEFFLIETLGKDFKLEIIYSITKNAFNKSQNMRYFTNPVYFQIILDNSIIKSYEDNEVIISKDENASIHKKKYMFYYLGI